LWERLGHTECVFDGGWPVYDPALTVRDEVEIAIQVMGKLRGTVTVSRDATRDAVQQAALADEGIARHVAGKEVIKIIHVPNRLMNFVVKR
jgi:leucyl-tRNA synthetase